MEKTTRMMQSLPPPPYARPHGAFVVVIVAQFLTIAALAAFLVFGGVLFALSVSAVGPLPTLIIEELMSVFVVALLLFPIHLVLAVGMFRARRWAIVLQAIASAAYAVAALAVLFIGGPGRSVDAQRSTAVLVLVLLVVLAVLNALTIANRRQAH